MCICKHCGVVAMPNSSAGLKVRFSITDSEALRKELEDNNNLKFSQKVDKEGNYEVMVTSDDSVLRNREGFGDKEDHFKPILAFKGFQTKAFKKAFSFGGFGVLSHSNAEPDAITAQELESSWDSSKKEPSKLTKEQIKEYSTKYKDYKPETIKRLPWHSQFLELTQPAHLIAMIAIVYLAFRLFPDSRRGSKDASTLTRLLYISSVSASFGAQLWMTFISGLALFFSVPRHVFAQVQVVLFPLFFLTNSVLMMVAIVTYTQHHPTHLWDTHQCIQGFVLVLCFMTQFLIRLYLAPGLTKLIAIKMAIEQEAGLGSEIGSSSPGILSNCPHYMRLHKAFRRVHMTVAVGNMISIAATAFHMYYLATKLCSVKF